MKTIYQQSLKKQGRESYSNNQQTDNYIAGLAWGYSNFIGLAMELP